MKYLYLLLFVFLLSSNGVSQGFLDGNPVWHIREHSYGISDPDWSKHNIKFVLGNDTTLQGKQYKVLLQTKPKDTITLYSFGKYLRESNDSVYLLTSSGRWREILYLVDPPNEPLYYLKQDICEHLIIDSDTVINEGIERTITELELNIGMTPTRFISGVGFADRMFWDMSCIWDHPWHHIRCLYRNDRLVYKVDDKPCYLESATSTSTSTEEAKLLVEPTRLNKGETFSIKGMDSGSYELLSIGGQIVARGKIKPNTTILMNESGMFILKIIQHSGRLLTKKIIVI